MTAEGPRKGEPSRRIMRYSLRTQPALLVRGSSRRIMFLRFRPAHISVINRRASSSAVLGSAVHARGSRLTSGNLFSPGRPSQLTTTATTLLAGKGALRSLTGPLPAPRRCGLLLPRWAAPAGTLRAPPRPLKKALDRSLHFNSPKASLFFQSPSHRRPSWSIRASIRAVVGMRRRYRGAHRGRQQRRRAGARRGWPVGTGRA
jgi:hypothetical protein